MYETEKQRILDTALPHVPFDGWTRQLFDNAVLAAGFEAAQGQIFFPKQQDDLVRLFQARLDAAFEEEVEAMDLDALKIRERIFALVQRRLQLYAKQKEVIRRLHGYYVQHPLMGSRQLWDTASMMWYAAGDQATDFNHYTKRFLLSGVMASTMQYWLQDESQGCEDSWAFLQRRIDNVMAFEKVKAAVKARVGG